MRRRTTQRRRALHRLGDVPLSRLEIVEQRRLLFDELLWQAPGLAFAGQAFLLTVALAPDTSGTGRLIAALFGFCGIAAVLQSLVKHRWTEEAYSEWINWHELRSGRSRLRPRDVLTEAFPPERPDRPEWETRRLRFLARASAFRVWVTVMSLFLLGDLALIALAVLQVADIWAPLAAKP